MVSLLRPEVHLLLRAVVVLPLRILPEHLFSACRCRTWKVFPALLWAVPAAESAEFWDAESAAVPAAESEAVLAEADTFRFLCSGLYVYLCADAEQHPPGKSQSE